MSQPDHKPGPLLASAAVKQSNFGQYKALITRNALCPVTQDRQYREQIASVSGKNQEEVEYRTRLLAAAYNAFDSAGKKLGLNPVELAERMQNGEIAFHSCIADGNGKIAGDEKAMAQAGTILDKVKGGAA